MKLNDEVNFNNETQNNEVVFKNKLDKAKLTVKIYRFRKEFDLKYLIGNGSLL